MDNAIGSSSSSSVSMEKTADPPPYGPQKKSPGGWRAIKYILGNNAIQI